MNLVIVLVLLAMASSSDALTFVCKAGTSTNGLGISKLVLDLSDEDPDAVMTLTYERSEKTVRSIMSYEGTSTQYDLTPSGKKDGNVSVILVKKNSAWTANVTDAYIDTFSVLPCQQK